MSKTEAKIPLENGWWDCQAKGECLNCGTTLYGRVMAKSEDESLSAAYIVALCFSMFYYPCESCGVDIQPTTFYSNFVRPKDGDIWFDNTDEHGISHFPDPPTTDRSWFGA